MGTRSKSKEKSTTTASETTTPKYQDYASQMANKLSPSMQGAYDIAMQGYGQGSGFNPMQQQLWSGIGQRAMDRWGLGGPGETAAGMLQPYLGQGYMDTLNPYFQSQQKYIEAAMPQQQKQFMQKLKKDFGPAWGTHGQALAGAADSYANFQAEQMGRLAQLEAQKGAAAQAGMGYTAANVGNWANLNDPFRWGQQAVDWAGKEDEATAEARRQQQQEVLGWLTPMLGLTTMGYQFPESTTTQGTQTSRGQTSGGSAGVSCCFIMNEAGDLTDAVRMARSIRYKNDLEVADGYRKMAKWLVPLMQKSAVVKFLVKWTMTHPIAKVAEVRKVNKHQPALYPIGLFWEAVWRIYGLAGTDQFKFSFVIKRLARATSM